jgi:GDP-L-fucose synthase
MTIRELAERIAETIGWRGSFTFDASKPDGTPRKVMDVSRLTTMGWTAKTPFEIAMRATYNWYLDNGPIAAAASSTDAGATIA